MGSAMVHELYTAASGLYICWLSIRAGTVLLSWMPEGPNIILLKVREWTLMVTWMSLLSSQPMANIVPLCITIQMILMCVWVMWM